MESADLHGWEKQLIALTGEQPVALTFVEDPPPGVSRIPAPEPAGCGFWRVAAQGATFYTEVDDHMGCAIGAYTHGAEMPPAKMEELSSLVGKMVSISYIKEEEVPKIPRRPTPLRFVVYAPLGQSPVAPDVVLVRGNARQLMLVAEAGRAAGHMQSAMAMGRPACAMVPYGVGSGEVVVSLGCVGNRVYTQLKDDQGYVAIPGRSLAGTMAQLQTIRNANETLEGFHQQRRAEVSKGT